MHVFTMPNYKFGSYERMWVYLEDIKTQTHVSACAICCILKFFRNQSNKWNKQQNNDFWDMYMYNWDMNEFIKLLHVHVILNMWQEQWSRLTLVRWPADLFGRVSMKSGNYFQLLYWFLNSCLHIFARTSSVIVVLYIFSLLLSKEIWRLFFFFFCDSLIN